MVDTNEKWLAILELDPKAELHYDDTDAKWYVWSKIRISIGPDSDNHTAYPWTGTHSDTREAAMEAMWRILATNLSPNEFVHATFDDPRHLKWQDGSWVEQPLPVARGQ
jgi:hypothetical protein